MQISPPFGYREIVPFLKTHKVRLPGPGELPAFALRSNALPVRSCRPASWKGSANPFDGFVMYVSTTLAERPVLTTRPCRKRMLRVHKL